MAAPESSANRKLRSPRPSAGPDRIAPIRSNRLPSLGPFCTSRGLLAAILPHFPGRLQLPVALRVDLLLPPRKHILRRDVTGGAVQADVVVVVHVSAHQTPCIIER